MQVSRFENSPVGQLVRISGIDGRTMLPYEHVAFVPYPLDDEPELTAATWRAVADAGYALGRLQQAAKQVKQVQATQLLLRPTLNREAQSTSALEGTFAPLREVLAADVETSPGRPAEVHEVLNYVRTAEAAFAWLAEGRRMTPGFLCELQRMLVAGTASESDQAGRVRGIQVAIGSPTQQVADARFVPPPPGTRLEAGLTDLLDWVNHAPSRRQPIVAAAMAHYQFETLHPFNDGNGRLGRLLVVVQLMQDGILDQPFLSVSPWFEARRAEYQDRLGDVSATGDWDGWVSFFATGLLASAEDTAARVDALLEIHNDHLARAAKARLVGAARMVAETLVGYPFVTVASVAARTGVTFQAANAAVARLVKLGMLEERTGRTQGRVFEATAVVDALLL